MGFGFILYLHSHSRQFSPNAHVYLIVTARIVELLGMNVLLCRSPPAVSRLTFTMVLNIAMTVHYIYTAACSDEYPIIHSGSRLMELCVVGIILLTVALHALTMYFVDGRIDLHRLVFHRSSLPRRTDDFSLAVLKLGTACLHATKLTGLSCELQALDAPLHTYVELHADGRTTIEHSVEDLEAIELHGRHPLEHEIRDVRVVLEHAGVEMGGVVRGADKMRAVSAFFHTILEVAYALLRAAGASVARFLPPAPAAVRHVPRYVRLFWHGTNGEAARAARLARDAAQRDAAENAHARLQALRRRRSARAARDDDLDDDLDPLELVALAEEAQGNARTAFQDVLVKHIVRPDHAPPLTRRAYHQLATQAPPARDTWLQTLSARAGFAPTDAADRAMRAALLGLLRERRAAMRAHAPSDADRERLRLCVVCCTEERTILCWPCRCVALCESCRSTLVAQQHALLSLQGSGGRPTQLCPTCRAPVAAFSRLYLP